jgi:hypothetical protein
MSLSLKPYCPRVESHPSTARPGMLASISEKCLEAGLSIENLTTELMSGPGGRREFHIHADCVTTRFLNEDEITKMASNLGALKDSLGLEVVDVRVQRLLALRRE